MQKKTLIIILFFSFSLNYSQDKIDNLVFEIISKVSKDNLEKDIISLANFGTRHTLSDTISKYRGIGAARRWIKNSFEKISSECDNCLEVFYQKNYFKRNNIRLIRDVWINNVVAIQRGYKYPNRYVIMSGDIDSRVSDPNDYESESPGANDNASGMAGTIEAVVHSHPQGTPASEHDRKACRQTKMPWYVYSVPDQQWLNIDPRQVSDGNTVSRIVIR